jgi:hypothetical protein
VEAEKQPGTYRGGGREGRSVILDTGKDVIRRSKQALLDALASAGADVSKPHVMKCPFHEDAHASAGIYEDSQVWRFKCHAGGCNFSGDVFDVRERASGTTVARQLTELRQQQERPKPKASAKPAKSLTDLELSPFMQHRTATYRYTHPVTRKIEMVVFRIEPPGDKKKFFQARAEGDGFVLEAPPDPKPLYNRAAIEKADRVLVVEGEKCVHIARELDVVATTSPGGAGKAKHADWRPLAGKSVFLWPDHDPVGNDGLRGGHEHMREVARLLQMVEPAPTLHWIDPEQFALPSKGDLEQYLEQYGGKAKADRRIALAAALEYAEPMDAAGELQNLLEDAIAGRRFSVPWPWETLGRLTKALLPGTVTCLCGDAGATKSFLLLQAAAFWHANGFATAVYELEEDRAYHLNRLLAQLAKCAKLTDCDWVKENPQESRDALAEHRSVIADMGRCIYSAPDEQLTLDALAAWVRQMASAGKRVIVIDPITAAAVSDRPWIDDLKFLMEVKTIVRQHGASLVLATHPRKGKRSGATLHDLAGGAAYQRFSQTVLWLVRHDHPERMIVHKPCGIGFSDVPEMIDRTLQLHKTRNAAGAGGEIGMEFDGTSLTFKEHGLILGDAEEAA